MNKKQNIVFLCHPYHRGGVTRWMADAAIASAAMGHEVYFVTVRPVKDFFSAGGREKMVDLFSGAPANVHLIATDVNYSFEFGTEEYRAAIYSRQVSANVPTGTPIIVSDDMAVWAAAASLADKYPMVGVLHGDQDYYYDRARKYHAQLSLCICVSERVKRNAMAKCPQLVSGKVYTIPCGINLPVFNPSPHFDHDIRLLFIGRLTDYEKRAADLVKIADQLHQQHISFHLDIAGNSDASAAEFTTGFRQNGTSDFVTFHGWRSKDELQVLLNKSDILLLTSNSEGMPLVMMEALASGCAFTGTRVSGIEDYEHNPLATDCVTVYTVGDIPDAVNKIKKAASVPVAVRQQAARKLAETEFSMATCLDRYYTAIAATKPNAITPIAIKQSAIDALYSKALALARYLKMTLSK